VLVCGDFKLARFDDELCSSNVTSAREYIFVDGMANNDLFQGNPIPNQCGVKRLPGS
jgi:hypothetical protein